ncbi:glycosyltransferase [Winkia sp. UMB10116]|uniref:glycosyltransferase family 2 protein n=1 Tax=Winkia sp. UMB10116 TaxID=3046355 RepID=UPI0025562B45|nr:glycosyltransferase [Winkia sp. UMB10116]MDK6240114.1 glycosyltransferase [Winkia sp. UMB10116]
MNRELSSARAFKPVRALVVTPGDSQYLDATLEAILSSTVLPDRVSVVDTSADFLLAEVKSDWLDVISVPGATSLGQVIAQIDSIEEPLLWLLHDDSAPAPNCLELLALEMEKGRTIAACGPSQLDFEGVKLLSAGIEATRTGWRMPLNDDIDQGQCDDRSDVLALGTAGLLLDWQKVRAAGGLDPSAGRYGEGLELGRRLHLAGHRVVLVAKARVRHAQESFRGERANPAELRRSRYYNAALAVYWFAVPFIALWALGSGLTRWLGHTVRGQRAQARAQLHAAIAFLTRPGKVVAGRSRIRRARIMARARLAPLELTRAEVRAERKIAKKIELDAARPAPLEPVAAAAVVARRGREKAALAASLVVAGILNLFLTRGVWAHPYGGAWLDLPSRWRDLAEAAFSNWIPSGLGEAGMADPILAILCMFTGPFAAVGISPSKAMAFLFAFLPLISFATAWAGTGVVTRAPWARTVGAFGWMCAPFFLIGMHQGRFAPSLAHALFPLIVWAVAGLVRAHAPHLGFGVNGKGVAGELGRPHTRAFVGILALLVVGAASPILGLSGALVYLVAGIYLLLTHRPGGLIGVLAGVPMLVAISPSLADALGKGHLPTVLLSTAGMPVQTPNVPTWALLAGVPLAGKELLSLLGAALAVLAVIALALPERVVAARISWLCLLAGAAIAVLSVSVQAGIDENYNMVSTWPGPGLTLAWVGLIGAAISTLDYLRRPWRKKPILVLGVALSLVLLIGGLGSGTYFAISPTPDSFQAAPNRQVPATQQGVQDSGTRSKVATLRPTSGAIEVSLLRTNTASLTGRNVLSSLQAPGEGAAAKLRSAVANLASNSGTDVANELADLGVGEVIIPRSVLGSDEVASPSTEQALARNLAEKIDAAKGITRIGSNDLGILWRVRPQSARLKVGDQVVPSGYLSARAKISASPSVRTLKLAERADSGWKASLGGKALEATSAAGLQSFEVPANLGGTLRLSINPIWIWPWRLAYGALVLGALAAAIWPERKEVVTWKLGK